MKNTEETEDEESMEEDKIDEEIEEEKERKQKKSSKIQKQETEEPKKRYIAVYKPQIMAVVDTVTEEIVAQDFADMGSAMAQAEILNKLDTIISSAGY